MDGGVEGWMALLQWMVCLTHAPRFPRGTAVSCLQLRTDSLTSKCGLRPTFAWAAFLLLQLAPLLPSVETVRSLEQAILARAPAACAAASVANRE